MARLNKSRKKRNYYKKYYSEKREEILENVKSTEGRKVSNKVTYEKIAQKIASHCKR